MPELPAGSVASITITRLSVVPTDFWLALGAIATVLLAIATVYLGWQTRDVSRRTADLAQTTTVELDLLKQQTEATQEQAAASREQLKELRQQHEEALRPANSGSGHGSAPTPGSPGCRAPRDRRRWLARP
jgi:hypothetical protein